MKAAIYARVSTTDKGQDTENQLSELRRFALAQGWDLFREYVDHESGGKADRPEFQTLFEDARRRKFSVVLFWSLDRLSREGTLPTLKYLETLTGFGVDYVSFTERYVNSCGPLRDAVVGLLAALAQQERVRLRERVRAGLARSKDKLERFGSYVTTRNGGVHTVTHIGRPAVPVTAEQVAQLRDQGYSWRRAAAVLGISVRTARRLMTGRGKTSEKALPANV